MMEPAQRTGREFCLGGTFRPAHGPDGLRPQGREQAANPRRPFRRHESKFLSFSYPFLAVLLSLPLCAQVRPLALVPVGEPRALPERILGASASPFWERLIDDPAKVAAVKSLHLAYTRFPGGSYSNYYDWKRGLFSLDPKPDSSAYYRTFAKLAEAVARNIPGGVSLAQYKTFSDSVGAAIVMVPNLETASVQDQVAWFKHLADQGIVPSHIELGNEFWIAMGFDPEVMRRWPDGASSMRTMRRYADAFRPYLPKGAKFAVQAAAAASFGEPSMRGPVMQRLRLWDESLRPEPWFDAVTVHLYPRLNEALGQRAAAEEEITPRIALRNLRVLMARADEGTDQVLGEIARRLPGKEIWVTEWSPRGAMPAAVSNEGNPTTPAMMLQLVTRMGLAILRNPQVTVSQFYAIFFLPNAPFRAFLPGSGGYQPVPAAVALRWLNEAANGGVTFQRFQESGGVRISGGGVRRESYGAVEAALFRGRRRAAMILQNVSPDSRVWQIAKDLNLGTPSRVERMTMADLADTTPRAARIETVQPSLDIPVPPYSVTRILWNLP